METKNILIAEEILGKNLKYCTPMCDGWDDVVESVLIAMEQYATERESKWRELYEAYKQRHFYMQRTDTSKKMATESSSKIAELRQKIAELEKELNLER